jgi:hypothetical protein
MQRSNHAPASLLLFAVRAMRVDPVEGPRAE